MSEENNGPDKFWIYIAGLVVVFAGVMYTVKSSEHSKYAKAEQLIAEDSSNSAYKTRP